MPLSLAAAFALLAVPAAAGSKAADYLVAEQIAAACNGGRGQIDPGAVIERDLTGDGNADLIISHEGINCMESGRSGFCGAQVCTFNIYVRRGSLLQIEREMLGAAVTVDDGDIPMVRWYAHGGAAQALKWDGRKFR
jgi:hypothetical protein